VAEDSGDMALVLDKDFHVEISQKKMKYRKLKGWKYQLLESYLVELGFSPPDNLDTEFVILRMDGRLILKQYYAWDGASGPCPDTRNIMKGSLVHDALYQLMRLGLLDRRYRKFADLELKRFCLKAGMNRFWARLIYWGVRIFCYKGVQPLPQLPVYEIP
jgi:hypothetical protein